MGVVTAIWAFLKTLSPKTWITIGVVIAVIGLGFAIRHSIHNAIKAADKAGYERRDAEVKAAALKLKKKIDDLTTKITDEERTRNVEAHRAVDARATTMLVRGPGKAVCPVHSGTAGAAGNNASGGQVSAPVAGVPEPGGQQLIALPFNDAVAFGKQSDSCEVDLKSWDSWYKRLQDAWPKP